MTLEFGHHGCTGKDFSFDTWGSGPFLITVRGVQFRFEDSSRFGPVLVNKRGDLLEDPYPPEGSPFWRAHTVWRRQGRRLDGSICIWDEPRPMIIRHIGGKHYEVIDGGDEDGVVIKLNRNGGPVGNRKKKAKSS